MKDNELRGLILQKYYDNRRRDLFPWANDDFKDLPDSINFDEKDLYRICDQLAECGLIDWHPALGNRGETIGGHGRISAGGVDVIEGTAISPISITLDQSHHVSIQNSSNVQVVNSNVQEISNHIGKIITAIDHSNATESEKAEAKSLLKKFLEHPLVTSIAGGAASSMLTPK